MSQDEFTKLFTYMQEMRQDIDRQFAATNDRIDSYAGAVDTFAKQSKTYMQEMLALSHKVDRLERWILKIAEETGVKLVA